MGIVILQLDYKVFIHAKNKLEALTAIHRLYEPLEGSSVSRQLDFVDDAAVITAPTLEEALSACRWSPENDDQGNIVELLFQGEKLGSEDRIFAAIAPFVESGSYIIAVSDDERFGVWRWLFEAGEMRHQTGRIVFEE